MTMIGSSDTESAVSPNFATPAGAPVSTAAAAEEQIKGIWADPTHALHPQNHHGNAELRRQWDNLYRVAYPDAGQPAQLAPEAPAPSERADGLPTLGDVLTAVP